MKHFPLPSKPSAKLAKQNFGLTATRRTVAAMPGMEEALSALGGATTQVGLISSLRTGNVVIDMIICMLIPLLFSGARPGNCLRPVLCLGPLVFGL